MTRSLPLVRAAALCALAVAACSTDTPDGEARIWVAGSAADADPSDPEAPLLMACFAPGTSPEYIAEWYAGNGFKPGIAPTGEYGQDFYTGGSWTSQGTPGSVTWSFIPDGFSFPGSVGGSGNSNLFAEMDSQFNNNTQLWIGRFQESFDRWEALCGLSFMRVTSGGNEWDDGASWFSSGNSVRGDLRIGMRNIDGPSNTLAFAFFPGSGSGGNMVYDNSENWNGSNQDRLLRNTIMHETGHAIGIQHVCPTNGTKIMEPFINTGFDGPQHDDMRAGQSHYGDIYESDNSSGSATDLGVVAAACPCEIPGAAVNAGSLCSIDANAEQDWFRFTLAEAGPVGAVLTPVGLNSYGDNTQDFGGGCNTGNSTNSVQQADLGLELIASNGSTVLASSTSGGLGDPESVSEPFLAAGDYFFRVFETSSVSGPQMYELDIATGGFAIGPSIAGFLPTSGPAGGFTTVTIDGSGFEGTTAVRFGGVDAVSFVVVDDSQIDAVTPSGAIGAADVSVVDAFGTDTVVAGYAYTVNPAVDIASVSPPNGDVLGGDTVTVSGLSVLGVTSVEFDGLAGANVTVTGAGTLTVVTPAGAPGFADVTAIGDTVDTIIDGFVFGLCASAVPLTYFVEPGGACPGSGTEGDPFCDIQTALDAACTGDTIVLLDGTYTGSGNRNLKFEGRDLVLRSANGPTNCIVDATSLDTSSAFIFDAGESGAAVLQGLTITGANDTGVRISQSSPTILDCVITGNESNGLFGGGITVQSGSPTFLDCAIVDNLSAGLLPVGGGANVATGAAPTFLGCTIAGNESDGTLSGIGGGLHVSSAPNTTVANCIVQGNIADIDPDITVVGPAADVTYSNLGGGLAGTGNIDADPLFLNPGGGDYRLGAGSPSIDAGDNGAVPADAADLDGDGDTGEALPLDLFALLRRFDDSGTVDTGAGTAPILDMGAHEFTGLPHDPSRWANLGEAMVGVNGAPLFVGEGALLGGDAIAFRLREALPNTTATLFIGLSAINANFKGGTLVPSPTFVIAGLPTGPAGSLDLNAMWPNGVPPGAVLYYQDWVVDGSGPKNLIASNAISSTSP